MRVSESVFKKMPAGLQAMFCKLPNPGSEEVLGMFPETETNPGQYRNDGTAGCFGSTRTAGTRVSDGDTGSAARFFYCAKAGRAERGEGNHHPTVKPLALMEYLCRLLSQPGHKGVLLDPFAGSGSTLLCASKWFERAIGIEQDEASCVIAASRLRQEVLPI